VIVPNLKVCFVALILVLWASSVASAGPVRISFLRDAALSETAQTLRKHRCNQEAVSSFERTVWRYYGSAFEFDFGKFPPANEGFYTFSNIQSLVIALPHPLWKTEHAYEFNCFDAVILLAKDHLRTALKPDERVGKFTVLSRTTNDLVFIEVATAAEAFTNKYPGWYRDATDQIFPPLLRDARVCLTATFFRHHTFPESVNEASLAGSVLETVRKDCRLQKLGFPKRFELVLEHQVDFPSHAFATTHAGLLFRSDNGYMYLEKAGGSGPFVRLDFKNRADLLIWLAAGFKGLEHEHTHVVATFNDTTVKSLYPPR